jgi:alpha-glucosidase (family GH31 glycosyl hydrolase)
MPPVPPRFALTRLPSAPRPGPRAHHLGLLAGLLALVAVAWPTIPSGATPEAQPPSTARPPLTPRWAYAPWVWEDQENTARAVRDLVVDYQERGIPVGAVIVDSPWQTNYNTFEFGPNYPDPGGLIRELHGRGVRVLLWATGFVNVTSDDGPDDGKAALYDEAHAAGYFVDGGRIYEWYKGKGSAIDFFNPAAVAWWYAQMDRAFALGPDGWKVDSAESNLPDEVKTAAGRKSLREYREAYYRAFHRYVAERNPEAIVAARPYAYEATDALGPGGAPRNPAAPSNGRPPDGGTVYAPVDAVAAGWVGDQSPDWAGLDEALDNILASAERGYAVLGSDIGGYLPGRRPANLFIRWTQLGALSPLMENGGRGEHRPWKLDREVLATYRYYAKLHHQLVPYLYSAGIVAHRTGQPIIRDVDRQARQYTLGEDLLVAPIVTPEPERDVALPAGARWHDYWADDRVVEGPAVVRQNAPLHQMPLFIRAGAIIPMQVEDGETGHGGGGSAGHLTVLVYPDGESSRTYHPDAGRSLLLRSRREGSGVSVEVGPQTERYVLRIKEPTPPAGVRLARTERGDGESALAALAAWDAFDAAAEGWYYDAAGRYLWVRFATEETGARLSYATPP